MHAVHESTFRKRKWFGEPERDDYREILLVLIVSSRRFATRSVLARHDYDACSARARLYGVYVKDVIRFRDLQRINRVSLSAILDRRPLLTEKGKARVANKHPPVFSRSVIRPC